MTRRYAFTLVELLVVIGIIAVLIAILLPALAKARRSAGKIACAAACRELGTYLNLYANDYNSHLPLTYWWGVKWNNALINSGQVSSAPGTPPLLTPLGDALFTTGYKKTPQGLYCALETSAGRIWGTSSSWPLTKWAYQSIGYGTRPLATAYPIGSTSPFPGYYYPYAKPPKITKLPNATALAADIIPSHNTVPPADTGHVREGLNVFYVDGSVQWVPFQAYALNYGSGAGNNLYTSGSPATGVWVDLDTYHQQQ